MFHDESSGDKLSCYGLYVLVQPMVVTWPHVELERAQEIMHVGSPHLPAVASHVRKSRSVLKKILGSCSSR